MARMHGKVAIVSGAAWERLQAGLGRGQRMAQPEEIASLVSYLASDDAVNVNGAVPSDGGGTAA